MRRSKRCYRTISEYCAYKNAGRSCFSSLEKLWRKDNLKFRCAAAEKTRTKRQYFACVRTSCFPYPTSNRKSQHVASYLWQLLDSASVSEAILFHSDHVHFRERIHFHRTFRENSKKAGCLLEAGTIHLASVGKVLFLSSFASAGGD